MIYLTLRQINPHDWQLVTPKGHPIGPIFQGSQFSAIEWAQAFVSSWYNWSIVIKPMRDDCNAARN